MFNDGPSWKEHRNFVTHEFRKFGFGNQSIEQRIQIVVDEYLHEISVSQQQFQIMDRWVLFQMGPQFLTFTFPIWIERELKVELTIRIQISPRLFTTSSGHPSAVRNSVGTILFFVNLSTIWKRICKPSNSRDHTITSPFSGIYCPTTLTFWQHRFYWKWKTWLTIEATFFYVIAPFFCLCPQHLALDLAQRSAPADDRRQKVVLF